MAHKNDPKGAIPIEVFYEEWIQCDYNATKAYQNLKPDVTESSAGVQGARYVGRLKASEIYETMIGKATQVIRECLDSDVERIKLDAAKDTLNRGHGMPKQAIDHTTKGEKIDLSLVSKMSNEEVEETLKEALN